jgi:hypothetical protein
MVEAFFPDDREKAVGCRVVWPARRHGRPGVETVIPVDRHVLFVCGDHKEERTGRRCWLLSDFLLLALSPLMGARQGNGTGCHERKARRKQKLQKIRPATQKS